MNKNRLFRALLWPVWLFVPSILFAQDTEPVTLKQAVTMALKSSREVALAQARYASAQKAAAVNRSAFQPNLYTGSGAAYTYGFPQTPGGAAPSIVNFSYLQTFFNPKLRSQTSAADERSEVQRLEVEKARNSVALQTSTAYLELGKVLHSLELMRNQRQSAGRIMDFTRQRLGEGLERPIELTRAELAAAKIEQRIVQMEGRQNILERQLAALMGMPPDRRLNINPESLPPSEDRERDLIDRALDRNIDLRQAEYERRAREHLLAGEIGTKWPTVDLFGQYGLFGRFNNFQDYFRKFQHNNFNVGLEIRIPIVSAQRSANVAFARSELSVAEQDLNNRRQNIELEVLRQYRRLRELDAAREVARLELKLAQENLQIIQANFQEGRASLREVENARVDENDKWLAFLDGDYDFQKAQLDLLNTTGELSRLLEQ